MAIGRGRRSESRRPPVRHSEQGMEILRICAPSQLPAAEAFCRRGDILHVHHAMLWDVAERVAEGRPTVLSVHVAQALMRQLRGRDDETASEQAQRRAIEMASAVTIPSAARAPSKGARVVPLGTEPVAEPAVMPEQPTALYVGRFGDVKGTRELIEAIGRVAKQSRLRFVVAGGLPDNRKADARWRRRFAERAPSAELLGWLSPGELREAYRSASFVVVPSWYETFGQVVCEAMQHGVPAIASDVGAMASLLGDAGVVVPPRDISALCDAIVALAGDRARQLALRQACLRRAPEWHWERRVGAWLRLYEELLGWSAP